MASAEPHDEFYTESQDTEDLENNNAAGDLSPKSSGAGDSSSNLVTAGSSLTPAARARDSSPKLVAGDSSPTDHSPKQAGRRRRAFQLSDSDEEDVSRKRASRLASSDEDVSPEGVDDPDEPMARDETG